MIVRPWTALFYYYIIKNFQNVHGLWPNIKREYILEFLFYLDFKFVKSFNYVLITKSSYCRPIFLIFF